MKTCYDCGLVKETGVKHTCVERDEPEPGTTYELERFKPDPLGMLGSYAVDIYDASGKSIAGLMHDRSGCEKLLRVRGFKGPFVWPTVAESIAKRKAKRARARGTS